MTVASDGAIWLVEDRDQTMSDRHGAVAAADPAAMQRALAGRSTNW